VKTGGTSKCFSSDGGGHGSGKMIQLYQVSGTTHQTSANCTVYD
jgi:hypothetical protein